MAMTGLATAIYPQARKYLLAEGQTEEQVDAMPVLQVAAIYVIEQFERDVQNSLKWVHVPYPQARGRMGEVEQTLREREARSEFSLSGLMLPALSRAYVQGVILDRRIAALRCVEALRMHAAATGEFPASLDAVEAVPVPNDPLTGGPFAYEGGGTGAQLSSAAPDGVPERALRYDLILTE